jgi:hypothetical protein
MILLHVWLEVFILSLQVISIGRDSSLDLILIGKILATQKSTKSPFSRKREKRFRPKVRLGIKKGWG